MKTIILTIVAFLAVLHTSAHAVFLETNLQGAKGKSHTVKVVYGEPGEYENIADWWWYKAGTQVTLELTKPDGSKVTLPTVANEDNLSAKFVPDQDGVYHVSLQLDTDRKEGAKTQYQIHAVSTIRVGGSKLGNNAAHIGNELHVYVDQAPLKNKKEVSLTLYEKGVPVANSFLQVIAPSGWIRWVETDSNGTARFIPEWKGKYFAEASKKEKVQGQVFEEYSRATTMSFEVE